MVVMFLKNPLALLRDKKVNKLFRRFSMFRCLKFECLGPPSPQKRCFSHYIKLTVSSTCVFFSAIAVSRPFGDSADMTVQEVHIDTTFCLSRLTAVRKDTLLTEEIAYHPNLRWTRISALTISLILDCTLTCLTEPVSMGLHSMQSQLPRQEVGGIPPCASIQLLFVGAVTPVNICNIA